MRLVLVTTALLCGLFAGRALAQRTAGGESCVRATCNTQYVAYGYNHTVHLENTCGRPMTCRVASDANPQAVQVQLATGASSDTRTFTGSPASVCRAIVSCTPS